MAERVCCSYQNVLSIQNRVCCLYRVSTTKQVDHDDQNQADIPVQRKACREFAERMGWTIVYEEQENGVSGFKVSANDRDKIQLIKEYAEQGKFDILLVFMFDRIGRRAEETPFVVEWLINHGIQVWSVNEGEQRIDTHVDRLTNYIRFWQADGESQKTSMRTKAALGQMVEEGRFRGGSAPYGYDLVPSGTYNKRKHEVFKLEINPDEAKVVRMMFDLCVGSGYGRFKIANFLSEMGIKTRDGKTGTKPPLATSCTTSCTPVCFGVAVRSLKYFLICRSSHRRTLDWRRSSWPSAPMSVMRCVPCPAIPEGSPCYPAMCSADIAEAA